MEEFNLEIIVEPGLVKDDIFTELEQWVQLVVNEFRGEDGSIITVSEEDIKEAKANLAKLRKLKEKLESERKRVKKILNAPYEEFEQRYKKAVIGLQNLEATMDADVKAIEQKALEERKTAINSEIESIAESTKPGLSNLLKAPDVWSWFYVPSWENKSLSQKQRTQAIEESIKRIAKTLTLIETSEDKDELLIIYRRTGDYLRSVTELRDNKRKREEFAALSTAKHEEKTLPKTHPVPAESAVLFHSNIVVFSSDVTDESKKIAKAFRIFRGEKWKILQLLKFAEEIGLEVTKPERQ